MKTIQRDNHLILKVLIIGSVVAVLIYLFHPGVGYLNLTINGQPVANPWIRLAALPTFLLVMGFTGLLTILLFFGLGALMFLGCLLIALATILMVAPYFWPMLVVIGLVIALSFAGHGR